MTCPDCLAARVTADSWRRLCLDLETRLDRARDELRQHEQTITRLRRHQPLWGDGAGTGPPDAA